MKKFHTKIQMFLMKENQKHGELKFITSRATVENMNYVEQFCKSVKEIFLASSIPVEANNVTKVNIKCIESFKYLLLNTNFKCQKYLIEDTANGHLVDMCPALSPFLFIQILWEIGYEEILIESLLHLPIDLYVEILETTRRCIKDLDYEKSTNILYRLILNTYKKCILLKTSGSQSMNFAESIDCLIGNFQELTIFITDYGRLTHLTEATEDLKLFEHRGLVLKQIIQLITDCMKRNVCEKWCTVALSKKIEESYKVTFGQEPLLKSEELEKIEEALIALDEILLNLLLGKIKEIDCNTYLEWAELSDKKNGLTSLQCSIGNECYYFIEFLKGKNRSSRDDHLIKCLQQLSLKPTELNNKPTSILTLEKICYNITQGNKKDMKELVAYNKELLDDTMLDFIMKNKSTLKKDDCTKLIEHLNYILAQSQCKHTRELTYTYVTKILFQQNLPDIYEIITEHLINQFDQHSVIEFLGIKETFNRYIIKNTNLRSPKNIRIILLFLVKDLKTVLSLLLQIAIGCNYEYSNILITANDFLLLSPFMRTLQKINYKTFIINTLNALVCSHDKDTIWNTKKFGDFLRITLENSIMQVDDLMNNVFIPYLEKTFREDLFSISSIRCILNHVYKLKEKCTKMTDVKALLISIGKGMSFIRRNACISKLSTSELFVQLIRILEYFMENESDYLDATATRAIVRYVENCIEPIDKAYFTLFFPADFSLEKGANMIDLIEAYQMRCHVVIGHFKKSPNISDELRENLTNMRLLKEDFLRYLILRSTIDTEYCKLGIQLTMMHWFMFGWRNEIQAYNEILRLTVEACWFSIEYPNDHPPDSFVFLVKCIEQFFKVFCRFENNRKNIEIITRSLLERIGSLCNRIEERNARNALNHLIDECCIVFGREKIIAESSKPTVKTLKAYHASHHLITFCTAQSIREDYNF